MQLITTDRLESIKRTNPTNPDTPAIEIQTSNHWTPREVLNSFFKVVKKEVVNLLSNKKSSVIFFYYSPVILSTFIPLVFPYTRLLMGLKALQMDRGQGSQEESEILPSQAQKISKKLRDQMSVWCVFLTSIFYSTSRK